MLFILFERLKNTEKQICLNYSPEALQVVEAKRKLQLNIYWSNSQMSLWELFRKNIYNKSVYHENLHAEVTTHDTKQKQTKQNTTQKTKKMTLLKTVGEPRCSRRVGSSCSL